MGYGQKASSGDFPRINLVLGVIYCQIFTQGYNFLCNTF